MMCSVTRIRRRLRHLPQLRRLLSNSGELFRRHRSSLAEGEHTIAFVSSISFRFAFQSTVFGRSYLIRFVFSFSVCSVWAERPPSANHRPCRPWIRPPSCIPAAGEHFLGPPCFFLSVQQLGRASWAPNRRWLEWPGQEVRSFVSVWERRWVGRFANRSVCSPLIFLCSFVSCKFPGKPPTKIPLFTHKTHPRPFYRSNPEFYPFHEHYLMCLVILFSYSLLSRVNHV
jgi:hypothetical protein